MIKSGTYRVGVFFGNDKSVSFKNVEESEMQRIVSLVSEQGPPFRVDYRNCDFVIINPDKVASVSVSTEYTNCPTCGNTSWYAREKDCKEPEYHR